MGKRIKDTIFHIIPAYSILPLLFTVIMNSVAYYGGRLLAGNLPHIVLETPLDNRIPLIPWTLMIYFGCYIFWIVNYILIAREDRESVCRFFSADITARLVCFVFFLVLPTTNIRPEIPATGFWNQGMRFLYRVDAADNLFPSIHCLTSWFCYIGIRNRKEIPSWYQKLSCIAAIAVFISTLTTKQHVLFDVAGGVILAEITWWAAGHTCLSDIYKIILQKTENTGRKWFEK
ncbi:MAG: phosphatase PAP2 family protein [Eubacterium sp.]|nr:phosphatase PAP2 family protein [Eubacterium sp.]MDD7210181.1 phosphatase PAP2 family protein [Lachnospiraceae bacterium]MDY5498281.1 phosphatase PAP2 family protein [Anaerobutyricum sp.]